MDDGDDIEDEGDETDDVLAIPDVRRTQKNDEMHSAVSARQNVSVLQTRLRNNFQKSKYFYEKF